jgi:hypothetical protein
MVRTAKVLLHKSKPGELHVRQQRIFDFLSSYPVGVLSSVSPDGDPHGVVVFFTVNKQFQISFLTRAETRKHDNLIHNNRVMLTVFNPDTQTTATIIGTATEITDSFDVNAIATDVFQASRRFNQAGILPINKLQAGGYVGFVISPVQIHMAIYAGANSGDYTDLFASIESFELEAA